ncbi:hypothetical protein Poli38472_005635 [Pythium oligandrum]|uniref:Uncharacterized protein n=1 Tax=Pythium oligandrum TaxID=41045 RepID=A0A8K1FKN6_PYTOL|nr:hypothetical protein Poli38472_005635 [Pythium oligandrum]|eukprot:TMW63017.1 hypothetical protein Poli38472_005635 [Pythium oligandrum]
MERRNRPMLLEPAAPRRISQLTKGPESRLPRRSNNQIASDILSKAPVGPIATKTFVGANASAITKKKVDEIFKRLQPHSIVQGYDKAQIALKLDATFIVNGETLSVCDPSDRDSIQTKWLSQQATPSAKTAASRPSSFHYAQCLDFDSPHVDLSLDTIKQLEVTLTSRATSSSTRLFSSTEPLTKKAWRLVAETDEKIGLALYEVSFGPWNSSALLVLAWKQRLQIAHFHLQLHVPEMLYCCPSRMIRILPDDVDKSYGLHSYTTAITLRDCHSVFWESECYDISFGSFAAPASGKQQVAQSELLDSLTGYRDRARYTTGVPGFAVSTEALSFSMENALIVDFCVWDASCNPIWGFTRSLAVLKRATTRTADDFSVSIGSGQRDLGELSYTDATRGNSLIIQLETLQGDKGKRIFVKQITVEFSAAFVNKTFGTNYVV